MSPKGIDLIYVGRYIRPNNVPANARLAIEWVLSSVQIPGPVQRY